MDKVKRTNVLKKIQIVLAGLMGLLVLLGVYLGVSCSGDECGGGWIIILFVIPTLALLGFIFIIVTTIRIIKAMKRAEITVADDHLSNQSTKIRKYSNNSIFTLFGGLFCVAILNQNSNYIYSKTNYIFPGEVIAYDFPTFYFLIVSAIIIVAIIELKKNKIAANKPTIMGLLLALICLGFIVADFIMYQS